jgi:hypothetical protein
LKTKLEKFNNASNDGPCHNVKTKHCNKNKGLHIEPTPTLDEEGPHGMRVRKIMLQLEMGEVQKLKGVGL